MGIFGRNGCNENTDWAVIVYQLDADYNSVRVCEQLAKKEAKLCYNKLLKLFKQKGELLEFTDTSGAEWAVPKRNIQQIVLGRI